ncbi:1-phosphatidylinositol 3-phosphate 5-kinase-like isoform X2 [Polyodon spathula]|uniref:1-phosphatidylinositol 3-phosphate 5-kinase-like isoform X2 n=1 Tax=Polyodon spathula TaxID=7913 RepID=UPI001B7EB3CD|nr:1-phosphatidylinositol 3-phosphate 5-kinase-like isoform X2 [Polyodon spathula]
MATGEKPSSSSSSTLDLSGEPLQSPSSPLQLTHFKPLTPEQEEPPLKSAYSSFVSLFRFSRDEARPAAAPEKSEVHPDYHQGARESCSSTNHTSRAQSVRRSMQNKQHSTDSQRRSSTVSEGRRKAEPPLGGHDPRTAVQLRSISTVLKRLKEIMEGRSQDSDLKQYWMPDSQCKECYDCSEKFTTFRRRHHCRLCGQIFCSRCCNQEIPGKFMGYTGDLRACTYCRKIALSYAHSADSSSIGEDLSALSDATCAVSALEPSEPRTPIGGRKASRNIFLEEDLAWQSLICQDSQPNSLATRLASMQEDVGKSPARKRSASITNLSLDRSGTSMLPYESSISPQTSRACIKGDASEEERKILLDSVQLKDLWKKICHHSTGMEFQDHRYWLRTYPNCIVGKELVNWLLRNGHISTRAQAIAIGQALADGRWLDCVTHHDQLFRDEYVLYRPLQSTEFSETPSPDSDSVNSLEGHSEPSWFKDIKFDDSDTEQIADEGEDNMPNSASPSKRTSVSSFQSAVDSDSAASISLNVEMDNVNFHIKKQSKYPHVPPYPAEQKEFLVSEDGGQHMISISDAFIRESLFNRRVEEKTKELLFTPLGWHHSSLEQLREENGEKQAMERLLSANHSHMMALLQQLLYSESLSLSWRDIIVPVVRQVVQTVRPDVRNNDDDMDIRQCVHVKKIPGGKKFDSAVVNGFVCTKNIAHKKMNSHIKTPKILLLKCSIEYLYREETKFTCIDPIVLQVSDHIDPIVLQVSDHIDPIVLQVSDHIDPIVLQVSDLIDPIVLQVSDHIDPIVLQVSDLIDPIVLQVSDLIDPIVLQVSDLIDPIVLQVSDHIDPIVLQVSDHIDPIVLQVSDHIDPIVLQVSDHIDPIVLQVSDHIDPIVLQVSDHIDPIVLQVSDHIDPIVLQVSDLIDPIVLQVSDHIDPIVLQVSDHIDPIVLQVSDHIDPIVLQVSDLIDPIVLQVSDHIDPIVLQVSDHIDPIVLQVSDHIDPIVLQVSDHIDPIVLQEREFLKNYVQRIVDVRPDLVLVEKTVSRIAQDMLLEHGITLVINVKPQVLDRVSRMTQGDLVMSMDQLLTKPRLGTCHKFYMHSFQLASDQSKTLMFFEGCPLHLGCTIKLRGASEYELARVKDIIIFMICVAYHSQLEISFLMDEFAMPPSLAKSGSFHSLIEGGEAEAGKLDLFQGADVSTVLKELDFAPEKLPAISESVSREVVGQFVENGLLDEKVPPGDEKVPEKLDDAKIDSPEMGPLHRPTLSFSSSSSSSSSSSLPPAVVLPPFLVDDAEDNISQDSRLSEASTLYEGQCDGPAGLQAAPRLFRDPLQDDTGMYITELVTSSEDRLKSHSVAFKQELKDVILCISPFISFKEPFLLTQKGMRCPSRDYFHEQVYLSPLVSKEFKEQDSRRKRQLLKEVPASQPSNGSVPGRSTQVLPSHELTNTRIADHLSSSQGLSRMLADFRARGGRIRQKDVDPFAQSKEASGKTGTKSESEDDRGHVQNEIAWGSKIDCLNPANHQRLCVLFSSSSTQSSNAPNPCVSPWIVTMEFYGKNDLTLGIFLERYCFRPSYQCPSMLCETPMVHHIRRFVHGSGCVQIVLKELDSPVPGYQHTILTYSWCRICKQVTPVVPLSNDSWSMSFAKYLELRFYGHQYSRRANAEPCGHSIHNDYHQYFSYNQMVASFSYTPIRLFEVCLPPPKIYMTQQTPSKGSLFQDLKDFSQKVSQVYLAIDDRLTSLKTDTFNKTREEKMEDLFAQKEMEEVEIRNWIEKLQARLQSFLDTPQQLQAALESIIVKKQSLCEMLQSWNNRLQDLFQQEKGRKRPSVPASPGRHRQAEENKTSVLDSSPRNASPVVQNGDKEDRYLSNMPSSSTLLQLPSPPEGAVEPLSSGPSFPNTSSTSDQDSSSITEDVFDGHLLSSTDGQVKEKSTMKAIFANLLPGNSYNPIPFPFEPDKHYLMYEHERVPIAVCEKEPSSIIAFALSCKEYKTALEELSVKGTGEEGPPPLHSTTESRAKTSSPARQTEIITAQLNRTTDSDMPKEADGSDKHKKQLGNPHIELQFSDANAKFYCRIYYAEEFHKMRAEIMESRADDFIRSLAHCVNWQARGGKSGAVFYATEDDRFILKQMPRLEIQSFLDFAPHYFTYITGAVQQKRPTALAKILGVYRIGYKNSQNNTEKKLDLLVMENLFYGRKMSQVFDLKGSLRNRNVKTDTGKESCEVVLLDENLLKLMRDSPLYIRSHCKSVLRASIHSDAYFLSSHLIIDYSLLVGRDDSTDELVVGIIDYIRTFTWDKKLEMVVKSTGILGGQGKMPTVVSPELYRTRFCEAMDKYFLMVPDHWTGLGINC